MNICPTCQTENKPNHVFCKYCGEEFGPGSRDSGVSALQPDTPVDEKPVAPPEENAEKHPDRAQSPFPDIEELEPETDYSSVPEDSRETSRRTAPFPDVELETQPDKLRQAAPFPDIESEVRPPLPPSSDDVDEENSGQPQEQSSQDEVSCEVCGEIIVEEARYCPLCGCEVGK